MEVTIVISINGVDISHSFEPDTAQQLAEGLLRPVNTALPAVQNIALEDNEGTMVFAWDDGAKEE